MIILGKHILLRTVNVTDSEFIYNLRRDSKKTAYLSKISGTVQDQKEYIRKYKEKERNKQEFYFVIENKEKEKLGLVRIYDIQEHSFSWGSWLIKDGAPSYTAIESALQIYEFGFYTLGFSKSHFEVQKGNDKVLAFHTRFGAQIVDENAQEYFLKITKKTYEVTKLKYRRYLP